MRMGTTMLACQICGAHQVRVFDDLSALHRVTSDSRPFQAGGLFGACEVCSTAQVLATDLWREEIAQIYAGYRIYEQANGVEHGLISPAGRVVRRSAVLAKAIRQAVPLPADGRILDVGCGNGSMLASFSAETPGWQLCGLELNDKYRPNLEKIPGFSKFYVGDLDVAEGQFDVVTMLHALEHFENPRHFLERLKRRLTPEGILFVEVPDFSVNPFDLLVADHCCHFTLDTLVALVTLAGYEVIVASRDWVKAELSLIARPIRDQAPLPAPAADGGAGVSIMERNVDWLKRVLASVKQPSERDGVGLFGTSLAATWLHAEIGDRVEFFVDEDPSRHGHHCGKIVIAPAEIPAASNVFLPFPPSVASKIEARLTPRHYHLQLPPALD